MRWRSLCVGLCAAVLVVSCSSDSDGSDLGLGTTGATAASPPTTEAPETTAARTTVAVTTSTTTTSTTEPPITATTAPPPTEAPTTAAPPPTEAPTTTAELSAEDKVKADFEAARLVRSQCGFDPVSCDYAAMAVPGSPTDLDTRDLMQFRLDNNLRSFPGKGEALSRIESVGFEGEAAFVTSCLFDSVIVFDIADPANPDDDIIYNDERNSYETRWELRLVGSRWLLYDGVDIRSLKDGDLCGFG